MQDHGFLTPLRVENVDAKNWKILERLVWLGTKKDIFQVEPGETTDFASTPRFTWILLPPTGTWTKAAVLHDKMCNELNKYHKLLTHYKLFVLMGVSTQSLDVPVEPVFNSIDADAIFRMNAREGGTDAIRSELLWMGVRLGALRNPARRGGWLRTAPRVIADLIGCIAFLYVCTFIILFIAHSV